MKDAFFVIGLFVLAYFAVLNTLYLVFTAIAWRSLTLHRREREYAGDEDVLASPLTPGISVLLPAYNEEAGVVHSVRSLLALRYPRFEIVVINDGSKDSTLACLIEAFDLVAVRKQVRTDIATKPLRGAYVSRRHPDLVVLDKENGGKSDALNVGVNAAHHPYFCAVDGDAVLETDALLQVAKPVIDSPEEVVATGGIVRIANGCTVDHGRVIEVGLPRNALATLQVVEYFRAFLVGRTGWSKLRSLLIISGAFGLFRRDAVAAAGGYSTGTVGEDIELVVRLHRHFRKLDIPYRIEFVPDPVCWTEAPETIRVLSRQRRRWQRGLAETLWRHRGVTLNPRYRTLGLLAFPYFILFELLGPVVALVGYVLLPIAVALGLLAWTFLIAFGIVAVLLGLLLSVGAIALEEFSFRRHERHREIVRLVAFAVIENFGYRQLLDAFRGLAFVDLASRKTSWGEMTRRGIGAAQPPP